MLDLTSITAAEAEIRIEKLRTLIHDYNRRYYDEDNPLVSDAEYDQLLRELEALEAAYPLFQDASSPTQVVGGTVRSDFSKVTHAVPMQSLQDYFSQTEVVSFLNRVRELLQDEDKSTVNPSFVVEQKIDGVSVSLEYRNGIYFQGLTRGDGLEGEDITENLRTLKDIPNQLQEAIPRLIVRGEVYMPFASFERLNERQSREGLRLFANPRNAASGSLRQLDPTVTASRYLSLFIFNIQLIEGKQFTSHLEGLEWLATQGFPTIPLVRTYTGDADIWQAILDIENERNQLPYGIDGAVIKVDSLFDRELLGQTSKVPRWAGAFKYAAERQQTRVEDIVIQVGRTGVLTPLAILTPVLIDGSTVSRATLHNEDYIAAKDIRVGDLVWVEKAGDIIPSIISVDETERPEGSKPYKMPSHCPSCGSEVTRESGEAAVRCTSPDCPAQLFRHLVHFTSRDAMNIIGFGESKVQLFLDEKLISGIADIYQLHEKREQLLNLPLFGEKSVNNLLAAIEDSKGNSLERLIHALGIRHIGINGARVLAEHYPDLKSVMQASPSELAEIADFGDITAKSIHQFFQLDHVKKLIEDLAALGLNMQSSIYKTDGGSEELRELPLTGKTLVITGTLPSLKRKEAQDMAREAGAKVVNSVSQKTDFVLYGEKAGRKLDDAKELGIELLTEEDFLKLIQNMEK